MISTWKILRTISRWSKNLIGPFVICFKEIGLRSRSNRYHMKGDVKRKRKTTKNISVFSFASCLHCRNTYHIAKDNFDRCDPCYKARCSFTLAMNSCSSLTWILIIAPWSMGSNNLVLRTQMSNEPSPWPNLTFSKCVELLTSIVNHVDYRICRLSHWHLQEEQESSSSQQSQILHQLGTKVSKRLSPVLSALIWRLSKVSDLRSQVLISHWYEYWINTTDARVYLVQICVLA